MLSDLYGRDNYQSHIEVGRDYWYYFPKDSEIENGWHKIRVTYIRSGCMFYFFPDNPEVEERFCPLNCFMASQFVLAEIEPCDLFLIDIHFSANDLVRVQPGADPVQQKRGAGRHDHILRLDQNQEAPVQLVCMRFPEAADQIRFVSGIPHVVSM